MKEFIPISHSHGSLLSCLLLIESLQTASEGTDQSEALATLEKELATERETNNMRLLLLQAEVNHWQQKCVSLGKELIKVRAAACTPLLNESYSPVVSSHFEERKVQYSYPSISSCRGHFIHADFNQSSSSNNGGYVKETGEELREEDEATGSGHVADKTRADAKWRLTKLRQHLKEKEKGVGGTDCMCGAGLPFTLLGQVR